MVGKVGVALLLRTNQINYLRIYSNKVVDKPTQSGLKVWPGTWLSVCCKWQVASSSWQEHQVPK